MNNLKQILRTTSLITSRNIFNNYNSNLILIDKQVYRNFHQTNKLETINLLKSLYHDATIKLKELTYSGSQTQAATVYLLESSVDNIDYMKWFEYFELKDSISSWYQITILHNWMILVRISEAGIESEYFKKQLILRQWEDLSSRISKLGLFPSKDKSNFLKECDLGFQAALVAYDEGLIGSDRELAASLWRTFFEYNCKDFTKLETLVHYVRLQLQYLASLKNEDLKAEKHLEWRQFNFPTK